MNGDTIYDLDLRRERQCFHCGIWYPAEYVEAQPEEGWDIDLNRPFYACKRCLGRLVGSSTLFEPSASDTYLGEPE